MRSFPRLLLLAATAALAACDNNPNVPPLHETRPDGRPWIVTYRAFPEDPRTLDPQVAYDEVSHSINANIYDTLLTYDPMLEDYVLQPMIGAELPVFETHADGTATVTCRIKPGLFFHDDPCFPDGKGPEITSGDFVYAFQRMADPKVECPIASTFADYVVGFGDAYAVAGKSGKFDYDAPFRGVEALDRYSFRINLTKPYPQMKYWLAYWFTAPVSRVAVEYYDGAVHDGARRPLFRFHPVGTGAFRLKDWQRGQFIRLVRNPNYHTLKFPTGGWPKELDAQLSPYAGTQLPSLDEVQLIVMRESIPAWILFTQGWTDSSGVGKDVFRSVIDSGHNLSPEYAKRGVQLIKDMELDVGYAMFNLRDPVLANPKVRQALSLAYNADAFNEIFGNDILHLTGQLLPPHMFGYEENFRNPWRETNVEKGRQLLAEAGYPNGIDPKTGRPLEIVLDSQAESALGRQMADFERTQFEQLGIRVRIQENLFAQMLEKQQKARYQMVFAGWNADYPDPENFFALFYGPNVAPVGHNQSMYQNADFDRLFEQMATMEDTPQRAEIIRRMNEILLVRDCVIMPIYNRVTYRLRQPWTPYFVKNGIVGQYGGLRYGVIDAPLREKLRKEWNRKNYWPLVLTLVVLAAVITYGIRRRTRANV